MVRSVLRLRRSSLFPPNLWASLFKGLGTAAGSAEKPPIGNSCVCPVVVAATWKPSKGGTRGGHGGATATVCETYNISPKGSFQIQQHVRTAAKRMFGRVLVFNYNRRSEGGRNRT